MGHPLNATLAKAFGIANIVVAPEDVDAEGLKAAREIAALPAGAVALSRALMRGATDELLARIDQEAKIFGERLHSPEAKAAFEAFFARRRRCQCRSKARPFSSPALSRGIGLAIALRTARDGANIAIAAKTETPHPKLEGTIHSAAEAIEKVGGE